MAAPDRPDAAHSRWWQIFEVVVGVPMLVAIGLELAYPRTLPRWIPRPAVVGLGGTLLVLGILVVGLARRELARHRQPTDPGRPTGRLVTTGIFGISRNPLYLGGICALGGLALILDLPWLLLMLAPSLVAVHSLLIAPEERYLSARFGDEYRAYAAAVHRWLGRARSR